jgi:hypothetical protein
VVTPTKPSSLPNAFQYMFSCHPTIAMADQSYHLVAAARLEISSAIVLYHPATECDGGYTDGG